MAVGYRSSSVRGSSDTFSTNCSIPVPAGATTGDVVVCGVGQWEASSNWATITPPSGFTLIAQPSHGTIRLSLYWKRLTGTDTGSYTFTLSAANWLNGYGIAITGGLTSGDPVGANVDTGGATSTTYPSVSVTGLAFEPFLAWCAYNRSGGASTEPSGYVEVQDPNYGTLAYLIPGTTGDHTASGGTIGTSMELIAALVAVEPEPSGGVTRDLDGTASAAASATGAVAATRALTAAADTAAQATATLSAARGLTGSASSASSATGTLSAGRPLTGVAPTADRATGELSTTRPFDGATAAASAATGDLTVTSDVQLAGSAAASVSASGVVTITRGLSGHLTAAASAAGTLAATREVGGAVVDAAHLTGRLSTTRPLTGVGAAASGANGSLAVSGLVTRGQIALTYRTVPTIVGG